MKHRLNICVISETPYNTVSELSDILDYRVILTPDQLKNLNTNMIVMGIPPIELLSEDPTYSSVIITVCTQKEFDEHIHRVSEQTTKDTDIYNLICSSTQFTSMLTKPSHSNKDLIGMVIQRDFHP